MCPPFDFFFEIKRSVFVKKVPRFEEVLVVVSLLLFLFCNS